VGEALRAGRAMQRLFVARGAHGLEPLVAEARQRGVQVQSVSREDLDRLVRHQHHQGVAAEASPFAYCKIDDVLALAEERGEAPLVLVLDSLQDPQNFGTLLRTAQASGAHGVIIPEHRAVGITPAVSNASAGAIEHLRVVRVTNLTRALRDLEQRGVWTYGLDVQAEEPFWTVDWRGPIALVVGSEGSGLSRLVRETCDALVTIPMAADAVQSLNAAVAGSIVLYEALRQRSSR
jgi:23S rRNA (guanosine2251-2'-O)-methyltransferase